MSRVLFLLLLFPVLPAQAAEDGSVRFLDVTTWTALIALVAGLLVGSKRIARWLSENAEPALADLHKRLRHPPGLLPWDLGPAPVVGGVQLGGGVVHALDGTPSEALAALLEALAPAPGVVVGVHGDRLATSTRAVDPRWQGRLYRLPDPPEASTVVLLAARGRAVVVLQAPPSAEVRDAVARCDGAIVVIASPTPSATDQEAS